MKSISLLMGLSLFGVAFASGTSIGPYTPNIEPCETLCFDSILHRNTMGYDPKFLKQTSVKTTCQDAFNDGVQLGYCSVKLGTL